MSIEDNQFLTFELSDEIYAILIFKIKENIGIVDITKEVKLPEYL